MITALNTTEQIEANDALIENVKRACSRIAPLWPLTNFVAVNPFVGLADVDFAEACRVMRRASHSDMTLPAPEYAKALTENRIRFEDLVEAAALHGNVWTPRELIAALHDPWKNESPTLTVADDLDARDGTRWLSFIIDEVSKWTAAYYDQGQALWRMPWRHLPLFRAWKHAAELDRTPEVTGLPGFRSTIKTLPDDALLAIQIILDRLGVPADGCEAFLHRELMSVRGWAGYVQYLVRENSLRGTRDDSLEQFLAIRLAYDFALAEAFPPATGRFADESQPAEQKPPALAVWQDALEIAARRKLTPLLQGGSSVSSPSLPARPRFQAVFCIDVRSEVFRRALEQAAPDAETIGFAGFFGFPIGVIPEAGGQSDARCPVLLLPTHQVSECACSPNPVVKRRHRDRARAKDIAAGIWKSFKSASLTCFPFVESLGLAFAAPLVRDSLAIAHDPHPHACGYDLDPDGAGIPQDDRIALAEGALKNMGLTENFARLVMICGHGSRTTNNPFGSSLDCGACGGHAGDANARVAVMVLNDPDVRSALGRKGIVIPDDTVFVAALHNTTGDSVELFDTGELPDSHSDDVRSLRAALELAGATARTERAPSLGIDDNAGDALKAAIMRRMHDWSEVRPEWGLAGNHAFIAAPRERTKHLDLGGSAFLHNYRHVNDPDDKILELIMCAPMVVASWINLQYFASSSNNAAFGSGNKVLHNVVGRMGVLEGNSGDLRAGLPWQSVHDGRHPAHTPLRLNVIIEAPRDRIDGVLARHAHIRDLVNNRWIHLYAWEDSGLSLSTRRSDGTWHRLS